MDNLVSLTAEAEIARLTADYLRDSPLECVSGKETYARLLAHAVVQYELLVKRQLRGELSKEEGRSLPGVQSNIRRYMQDLGLTKKATKPKASFV